MSPAPYDWRKLAELHKPTNPAAIAIEIRRLHSDNCLTARDISNTLRLDLGIVLAALHSVAA
jgi:hypothetical protein